jgi:hypothetical protein
MSDEVILDVIVGAGPGLREGSSKKSVVIGDEAPLPSERAARGRRAPMISKYATDRKLKRILTGWVRGSAA